ncbi:MAG: lipopolysaccharide biosynthesis protein [Chloroflexi bacterium]|nr:lipopolysaccharide biosynthesis protein [Chloroflexota bacterium]
MRDNDRSSVARLFGRGGIYTAGRLAQLVAGVAVLPVITRLLGPRQFGTVATAVVVTQMLSILGSAGLPAAITREYTTGDDGPARSRVLIIVSLTTGLTLALLVHMSGRAWSLAFAGIDYGLPLQIAVVASVPLGAVNAAQALLRAEDRAVTFTICALLTSLGAQAAGLATMALTTGDATHYLGGITAGYAVAAIFGLVSTRPWRGWGTTGTRLPAALRFSLPTIPHSAAMYLLSAADRVVLERVEGLDQVGRYQVAYVVGSLGILLLNAMNNAWGPLVYSASEDERWSVLAETSTAVQRGVAYLVGGIAVVGPAITSILAPPSYEPRDLAPVIALIALATLPYALFMTYAIVMFTVRRTGALVYSAPLAAAVNVVSCIALIPPFGLVGAAMATIAGYLVLTVSSVKIARGHARLLGLRSEVRSAWLLGFSLAVAGAVLPTTNPWLAVRIVVGAVLAVLLVRTLRSSRWVQPTPPSP